jgi:hypothetical protein
MFTPAGQALVAHLVRLPMKASARTKGVSARSALVRQGFHPLRVSTAEPQSCKVSAAALAHR